MGVVVSRLSLRTGARFVFSQGKLAGRLRELPPEAVPASSHFVFRAWVCQSGVLFHRSSISRFRAVLVAGLCELPHRGGLHAIVLPGDRSFSAWSLAFRATGIEFVGR